MTTPAHETSPPQTPPPQVPAKRPFQFTLRDVMLATAALCVTLATAYNAGLLAGYGAFALSTMAGVFYYVRPLRKAVQVAAVVWGFLLVGLVFMVLVDAARVRQVTHQRQSRARMIAVALHNYEATYGSFPPAYTVDAQGNRLHSWRTLILPFLGPTHQQLHRQLDLSLPWDDPANQAAAAVILPDYQYATHPRRLQANFTSYVAIVGPETMWPGETGRQLLQCSDGTAKTILLLEVVRTDIPWAEPRDITHEELLAAIEAGDIVSVTGFAPGEESNIIWTDGHIQQTDLSAADAEFLRGILTADGNEPIGVVELE